MGSKFKPAGGKADKKQAGSELHTTDEAWSKQTQDDTNKIPDNTQTKGTSPKGKEQTGSKNPVKARQTGIQIVLGEINDTPNLILGRIIDNTLTINTKHPAWQKAKTSGFQEYHVLLTVAVILSEFLEIQKSPQEFINRFLASWAGQEKKAEGTLF
jgi:hypothetical protein